MVYLLIRGRPDGGDDIISAHKTKEGAEKAFFEYAKRFEYTVSSQYELFAEKKSWTVEILAIVLDD